MKLTFWGAARQVTGSMYLLELEDEFNILIDCGLDMERKDLIPQNNFSLFPFEASQIHALILTHAHIDHSGYIPNLLREGFEGKIISTAATYELSKLLLSDSASLNHKRLSRQQGKKNKKKSFQKDKQNEALYLQQHVSEALEHFITISFNQKAKITKGVSITLIPAGHLLGAAHVLLQIVENGISKSICFSGDIGRKNYPLLIDPETIPEVDYLICETTYGNRLHQSLGNNEEEVLEIIHKTCVEIPGRLIIPAFSVGRTQAMLYTFNRLYAAGKLPPIKVFADSPLALKSTMIYQKYTSWLNEEARRFAKDNVQLFDFENLIYLENLKESKAIANYGEPCIIISSSGMIQGGRVEHHVKMNLQNAYATILMIGYASEGTLGYDLMHGKKSLTINKKEIPVMANVMAIDAFSGHADRNDLVNFVKYQNPQKLKKLFLVHGEFQAMLDFKETIAKEGYTQVEIPQRGESFEL